MSHWTKAKTKVTDRDLLKKALKRLGWEYEEGNFTVSQYGSSEKAEILLARDGYNNKNGAVGLSLQEDGTWAMVGDPYHAPSGHTMKKYYRQNEKFAADLQTAYAIEEATTRAEEQQFYCVENAEGKVGADGKIRMVFEAYA